mmetsp:Transcript_4779/g.9432  ORF Transcript_4779/g.9432 Transcript_4779/m.9432 type:complete len:197 (+) Transcript_4779:1825-2415(+)
MKIAQFTITFHFIYRVQTLCQITLSQTLISIDTVRTPSCVTHLSEFLSNACASICESAGTRTCAYVFSDMEGFLAKIMMENIRLVASGNFRRGLRHLTMIGINALKRSISFLYRDLKAITSFDGSFWNEDAAINSFQVVSNFVTLLELPMKELEEHYKESPNEFSDADYKLMFASECPMRKGDVTLFHKLKDRLEM